MQPAQTKAPLCLTSQMRCSTDAVPSDTARQLEALTPDLRRVARQLSDSWARADDLVQDTLLALWAKPDALSPVPRVLHEQAFLMLRQRAAARAGGDARSQCDVA